MIFAIKLSEHQVMCDKVAMPFLPVALLDGLVLQSVNTFNRAHFFVCFVQ